MSFLDRLPEFHRVAILITALIMLVTAAADIIYKASITPARYLAPANISTRPAWDMEVFRELSLSIAAENERRALEAQERERQFNDRSFRGEFVCYGDPELLRSQIYLNAQTTEVSIHEHKGGEYLSYDDMRNTVIAVLSSLPNIKVSDDMINLILETFMAETHFGKADFHRAAERYENYGLGQLRIDTTKETLQWLQWISRDDVHKAVMRYYDRDLSLADNLIYNVPFNIAMTAQVYWRKLPDLTNNIKSVVDRAIVWKSVYNTPLGLGTVNKYLQRVAEFNAVHAPV